jgi:hypothetical protein
MTTVKRFGMCFSACTLAVLAVLAVLAQPAPARTPQAPAAAPPARAAAAERDGQHDFDFIFGRWKAHLRRLDHPLTGSHSWLEYEGTLEARPLWGGRANIDEADLDGPAGHLAGLTLRLYNPETRLWSLNWANASDNALAVPTVGQFKDGRGVFYDQEIWHGKLIFCRYIWSNITPSSAHFEQSFSVDGGATWEVNWISDQTRLPG